MSVGPLVTEICCTFFVAALLLHRYGNWSQHHILVTINVFIAWYFSFIIIFILPLDVSTTAYHQCIRNSESATTVVPVTETTLLPNTSFRNSTTNISITPTEPYISLQEAPENPCQAPWSQIPEGVLPTLWRVVYWTAQALTCGYYSNLLQRLSDEIKKKRPIWQKRVLFHQDNAPVHRSVISMTKINELRLKLIPHAPYSPDLAPSDYFLFPNLKKWLGGKRFANNEEVESEVDGYFEKLDSSHYKQGIEAIEHRWEKSKLKVICITASNTWGLFLLVLLLGYGLVEIPRSCWNKTKRGYMLNYLYFKAAKLSTERCEAEERVDDLMEEVQQVAECVSRRHSYLKNYLAIILDKLPEEKQNVICNRQSLRDFDISGPIDRTLIRLHQQIIRALQTYRRTQCQWNMLVEHSFEWEDIVRNEMNHDHLFKSTFMPRRSSFVRALLTPKIGKKIKFLIPKDIFNIY
ncbi:LMBR1 domain-containing protein 2-like [Centruroides sculpturatus]|uniref:LMBR1 domain-containing protein 2-like n=1 Tax=Centruroides sculpturatus TaxID=218467 RepID=UPI000C6E403F|nr:LMBR1 domain-containing protein 2-like [Centruroides sculpturatus]